MPRATSPQVPAEQHAQHTDRGSFPGGSSERRREAGWPRFRACMGSAHSSGGLAPGLLCLSDMGTENGLDQSHSSHFKQMSHDQPPQHKTVGVSPGSVPRMDVKLRVGGEDEERHTQVHAITYLALARHLVHTNGWEVVLKTGHLCYIRH